MRKKYLFPAVSLMLFVTCFLSASASLAEMMTRYSNWTVIGSIRINDGGYRVSVNSGPSYLTPLPNEKFDDYCFRIEPVSREVFTARKRVMKDIFLLSPSRGMEKEVFYITYDLKRHIHSLGVVAEAGSLETFSVLQHECMKEGGQSGVVAMK